MHSADQGGLKRRRIDQHYPSTHRGLVLKVAPMRERHTLFGVCRELGRGHVSELAAD
jgi:hypothetical protein